MRMSSEMLLAHLGNLNEGQPLQDPDTTINMYTADETGEMSLADMLHMQLRLYNLNRSLPCYTHGYISDYVKLAAQQNKCAVNIARCLVTAARSGESLDETLNPDQLLGDLLIELSYQARKLEKTCAKVEFGYTFYFTTTNLISNLITTMRRLRITRRQIADGSISQSTKEKPARKGTDSVEKSTKEPAAIPADMPFTRFPEMTPEEAQQEQSKAEKEPEAQKTSVPESGELSLCLPELPSAERNEAVYQNLFCENRLLWNAAGAASP